MKKTIGLAYLLLILSGFLTGCGRKMPDPVEITLIHGWGTMEMDHVTMRQIYKDFEKDNPDVCLNLVSMPTSEAVVNKAADMMAVGKIPDLVFLGGFGREPIYEFVEQKGYAVDLMPYILEDSEFAADLAPELLSYWTTEEGCLFTASDVLLLSGGYWYNRELFRAAGIDQVPDTWDEFFDACDRLEAYAETEKNDLVPIQLNPENSLYLLDVFLEDEAVYPVTVTGDGLNKALDSMEKVYRYSIGTADNYSYRDVLSLFNGGKSAMYINGAWGSALIHEEVDAAYAAFPYQDGKKVSCVSACLGYIVGNTGDTKKTDASVRFVKYMLSDEVQKRILMETQQMPENPNICLQDYEEQMPRFYQAAAEVLGCEYKLEVPDNLWSDRQLNVLKAEIISVLEGAESRLKLLDELLRK